MTALAVIVSKFKMQVLRASVYAGYKQSNLAEWGEHCKYATEAAVANVGYAMQSYPLRPGSRSVCFALIPESLLGMPVQAC